MKKFLLFHNGMLYLTITLPTIFLLVYIIYPILYFIWHLKFRKPVSWENVTRTQHDFIVYYDTNPLWTITRHFKYFNNSVLRPLANPFKGFQYNCGAGVYWANHK